MDVDFSKLELQPHEVDTVIYHDPCTDGFSSAFSAYYWFKCNYPEKVIEFIPGTYGSFNFNKLQEKLVGKNILMADFSLQFNETQKLISIANKFAVLDHHITAQKNLENVEDRYKVFRMDHSGAYLTWAYFFRNTPPKLIMYVEDNDLWRKALKDTHEATAFLLVTPFEFAEFEKLLDETYFDKCIEEGRAMLKHNNLFISKAVKSAVPKFIQIKDKYYFVAHLNTTIFKSELGNILCKNYPYANFAAVYSIIDYNNTTSFSLRSLQNGTDVSEIAKIYGGGGHREASGFATYSLVNTIPGNVIANYEVYNLLDKVEFDQLDVDGKMATCVVLHCSIYRKKLAKYLLQTRYVDKDGFKVQEARHIQSIKTSQPLIKESIDISIVRYNTNEMDEHYIAVINEDNTELRDKFNERIIQMGGRDISVDSNVFKFTL